MMQNIVIIRQTRKKAIKLLSCESQVFLLFRNLQEAS